MTQLKGGQPEPGLPLEKLQHVEGNWHATDLYHLLSPKRERGWKTNTTSQGTCADPNRIVAAWRFAAKDATQSTHRTLTHTCSDLSTETTYSYTKQHSGS